jgi:toxin ParE1/3/4
MSRLVVFTAAALAETTDALEWYGFRSQKLRERFEEELDDAVARVAENPLQFRMIYKGVRRTLLHRFPYRLFFRVLPDRVQVIACLHTSRSPRRWQRRV